ncbi:MAG: helix-turn-helix domain-containing protein [Dinoroseobacter sp.]|nr:helix-turn-helix domain-containing protein [Dinoroseobacter sp.]
MTPQGGENKNGFEAWKESWMRQMMTDPDLSDGAKVVGMAVALRLNRKTRLAFPSTQRLMADTGKKRTAVKRAISELKNAGHVTTTPRFCEDNGQKSNNFVPTLRSDTRPPPGRGGDPRGGGCWTHPRSGSRPHPRSGCRPHNL